MVDHYAEAERLLTAPTPADGEDAARLAAAQTHAVLALASRMTSLDTVAGKLDDLQQTVGRLPDKVWRTESGGSDGVDRTA